MINKITVLQGTLIAGALVTQSACYGQKEEAKPNVLFLQTDQQVWYALNFVNDHFDTPNLNMLADDGFYFKNAICTTPSSSPARSTMITGMYPHSNTIFRNLKAKKKNAAYYQHGIENTDFEITEELLYENGYYTAHHGKWHLGKKKAYDCYKNNLLNGQSHSYSSKANYNEFLEKNMPSRDSLTPGDRDLWGYPLYQVDIFDKVNNAISWKHPGLTRTGRSAIPPEYTPHGSITDEAARTIKAKAGVPWMITVSWHPPHLPWAISDPLYSKYDRSEIYLDISEIQKLQPNLATNSAARLGKYIGEKGLREYLAIYRALVFFIDKQVGDVLEALKESGQYDNTLIIFTSDHGDMQGRFGCMGKSLDAFYNEVVRIPLIIKPPHSEVKEMVTRSEQVNQTDYMPTILSYCQIEVPSQVQGKSLKPVLKNQSAPEWRKYNVCERTYSHRDLVARMIMDEEGKYIFYSNAEDVYYDLEKDPKELKNLIHDTNYSNEIKKYKNELMKWIQQTNDNYALKVFEKEILNQTNNTNK